VTPGDAVRFGPQRCTVSGATGRAEGGDVAVVLGAAKAEASTAAGQRATGLRRAWAFAWHDHAGNGGRAWGRGPVEDRSHPLVGGIYRVRTVLLSGVDPKPLRPVVVVALPPSDLSDVPLLTRTSNTDELGVFHPRSPALGLTKDGVFAYRFQRSIDIRFFADPNSAEFMGMLEPSYRQAIQEWWEIS